MSDKRIIDLEAKQTLGSGDYLAADSAQGTYKVNANTNIMTPLANVRNNVANSSASPDKYSTSTAYKVGDMVIQNDILYKCTTACSAASWAVNSACFTATTLASVVTQLNSDLTNFTRSRVIMYGLYDFTVENDASAGALLADITINFDAEKFFMAPHLMALPRSEAVNADINYISLASYNISTRGAHVRARAVGGTVHAGTYYMDIFIIGRNT